MQVSTGATDYNTAIRNALKPFTDRGIVSITYDKDGKLRRRSIEAAVRQCVMQGARDMSKAYMQGVAEDIGADGWEISAHLNCAPDHQNVQGRQYSNERYQRMNEKLARPIGTFNCRHTAFPIILGVSEPAHTPKELYELKAENKKGVTYEGKHYTLYEASQQQRKLERSIRKTKRELIVAKEYANPERHNPLSETTKAASKDYTALKIRLRRLTEYYNDFSDKCKLTKRPELMTIGKGKKSDIVKRKEINEDSIFRRVSEDVFVKNISAKEATEDTSEDKKSKVILEDVTDEYFKNAKPGNGTITYEEGYIERKHKDEIEIAEYLHKTFGGDITLLTESEIEGVKTADYDWHTGLWELKSVTTEKSANGALRKALKQIADNKGGIIFNYKSNNIDLDLLKQVLIKRYEASGMGETDLMILLDEKNEIIVWRIKK